MSNDGHSDTYFSDFNKIAIVLFLKRYNFTKRQQCRNARVKCHMVTVSLDNRILIQLKD